MVFAGESLSYDKFMTRVYLADARLDERNALRLLLLDLKMEVVGEAADWLTTLLEAPANRTDMLLVDWDLLPDSPTAALEKLREACPAALVIVLISFGCQATGRTLSWRRCIYQQGGDARTCG
jgi:DNA-binding NarL/FixJ family response regulator